MPMSGRLPITSKRSFGSETLSGTYSGTGDHLFV
jgi:hypothetical protein